MRLSTAEQISDFLHENFDFAECIIESITFSNFQTDVTICLNFIWDPLGNVREDLDHVKKLVFLRFHLVESFTLINEWTKAMFDEPESIGWGINEIALIRVKDQKSRLGPKKFVELEFVWEGNRRIQIAFSELTVSERVEPVIDEN